MPVLRKRALVLLLGFTLAAPWAAAAQPRPEVPRSGQVQPAAQQLLGCVWGALTALWGKEGARLDPLGLCAPILQGWGTRSGGLRPLASGAGGEIDPLGVPSPANPGGGTASSSSVSPSPGDEGGEIDPLG